MNLFELATRKKFRFPGNKGELTVEQLWDLKLTSVTDATTLDSVAISLATKLKDNGIGSFVNTGKVPNENIELEQKLEVVKHIIASKEAENNAARIARANANEAQRLQELLERKQEEKMSQLTEDEILARLAALRQAT